MNSGIKSVFLVCVSLLLASCGKTSIFTNGAPTSLDTVVEPSFRVVELLDNVDVELKHGDAAHPAGSVHIEAGENIIENVHVDFEEDNKKITVRNKNTNNWLRPYDNHAISATIYYDSLYQVIFNSNGDLVTDHIKGINVLSDSDSTIIDTTIVHLDTIITHTDTVIKKHKLSLWLTVLGGAGDISLKTNTECFYISYIEGTAAVTVEGYAGIAQTTTEPGCHGPIDANGLETRFHFVTSYGTHRIKTNAFNLVKARNYNNGTIHFLEYRSLEQIYVFDSIHPYPVPQLVEVICPKNGVNYNDEIYQTQEYQNGMVAGLIKDTIP